MRASGNKVLAAPKKLMKNAILDFAKNLDLCFTNIFRQLNRAKRLKLIFRSEMGPLNQLKISHFMIHLYKSVLTSWNTGRPSLSSKFL